uniref:Ig-like domain-containing protein n=1 Tax=Heterorhabditis bacteriophora TaxID=37862 RepID=A0A1I7WQ42_HETBA
MPDNRGLRIDRVQTSDEGEYVCYARNPAGSIESSARLRVQAPPSFQTKPTDQIVPQGSTANFECVPIGQPTPGQQVFINTRIFNIKKLNLLFPGHVSADGRIKVSLTGTLSIADVRPSDEGAFVCAAMNSAGSSLSKAILKLSAKVCFIFIYNTILDLALIKCFMFNLINNNLYDTAQMVFGSFLSLTSALSLCLNGTNCNDGLNYYTLLAYQPIFFSLRVFPHYLVRSQYEIYFFAYAGSFELSFSTNTTNSEQCLRNRGMLTTINSTAVRLFWKRKKVEDMVDGYYIKWRGPPRSNINQWVLAEHLWVNSHVVNGLLPFTNYEFFVIPYHKAIQGAPSNSMDALTAEAYQETLDKHLSMHNEQESFLYTLFRQSWFVVLVLVLVWIFVCIDRMGPFIKINDGSVHMAQNGIWDPSMYNTAGRMTLNNRLVIYFCPALYLFSFIIYMNIKVCNYQTYFVEIFKEDICLSFICNTSYKQKQNNRVVLLLIFIIFQLKNKSQFFKCILSIFEFKCRCFYCCSSVRFTKMQDTTRKLSYISMGVSIMVIFSTASCIPYMLMRMDVIKITLKTHENEFLLLERAVQAEITDLKREIPRAKRQLKEPTCSCDFMNICPKGPKGSPGQDGLNGEPVK